MGYHKLHRLGALAKGLEDFGFGESETTSLLEMVLPTRVIPRGEVLLEEHGPTGRAYILHSGWVCSYKSLHEGHRQIIEWRLPGDFFGLKSAFLGNSDRSITAVTELVISETTRERVVEIASRFPRVMQFVFWKFARDEAIVAEHLANVGGRKALPRTAHFLLELAERLNQVGSGTLTRFECPLPQHLMADTLGVTSIHFNRCLGELRRRRLVRIERNVVELLDREQLIAMTGFDPGYITGGRN